MTAETLTPDTLRPATSPTMYFVGVTTGSSAIHRVFAAWRPLLGLDDVELVGIDVPVGAEPAVYRRVVAHLRDDELSRGALVTTHKLDLYAASTDLLRRVNDDAARLREVSALVARDGWIDGHALDTITSQLSLQAIVPRLAGRDVLVMGAGGAALALCDYFAHRAGTDAPGRVVVTDIADHRLASIRTDIGGGNPAIEWVTHRLSPGDTHDELLAGLAPGAVVVNATGMGKDRPGSPLTDAAVFPSGGYAWEFNYRGELGFLRQARARADADGLTVEDGWRYFVHGWTRAVDAVFDLGIPTAGPDFERLYDAAQEVR
ncbi:shikimate dehydrogenase family protein [Polymorphospora rubra]|uniref:Shikimate dehydrogenase n=1 Tax=Polymorphospora rubra TaxID=338584 RepID=A0A810MQV2_9ACTN|nr:hypothetical protein [Polymorphospora rubra]BCJ63656.1 hypothetical protein Prubr_06770 [Polymorphospora rubra]